MPPRLFRHARIALAAFGLALVLGAPRASALDEPEVVREVAAQRTLALGFEKKHDARAALSAWYRVIDSTRSSPADRLDAMGHVKILQLLVPPNRDPAKASVWRVKVLIFARTKFVFKDEEGKKQFADLSVPESDRAIMRRNVEGWKGLVFAHTRGELTLDYDFEVVDAPIVRFHGSAKDGFDPDLPYDFDKLGRGTYDSVLAYVLVDGIPHNTLGLTPPAPPFKIGAHLSVITYCSGELDDGWGEAGETELHEWLHEMDHVFKQYQGWPAIFPDPDDHRVEGEDGGDPCFRLAKDPPSYMPYYDHMMKLHATDRMWHGASLRHAEPNPWTLSCAREWRVAGPFPFAGEPAAALAAPTALDLQRPLQQRTTRIVAAPGNTLDFADCFPAARGKFTAVAETWIRSPRARHVKLALGATDGCRVFANGAQIYEAGPFRTLAQEFDEIDFDLPEGFTRITFRAAAAKPDAGLELRVLDAKDDPLPGFQFSADGPRSAPPAGAR
jgi:hypothetical protein